MYIHILVEWTKMWMYQKILSSQAVALEAAIEAKIFLYIHILVHSKNSTGLNKYL